MFALILLKLTLIDILSDMPHDTGAVIVYALVAVSLFMVWRGSRKGAGTPGPRDDAAPHR